MGTYNDAPGELLDDIVRQRLAEHMLLLLRARGQQRQQRRPVRVALRQRHGLFPHAHVARAERLLHLPVLAPVPDGVEDLADVAELVPDGARKGAVGEVRGAVLGLAAEHAQQVVVVGGGGGGGGDVPLVDASAVLEEEPLEALLRGREAGGAAVDLLLDHALGGLADGAGAGEGPEEEGAGRGPAVAGGP